ncbi:MAG: hypothetical protein M3Z32_00430 [Acidobacteriota bacterium]|nr:hypothetical protein [Acidobacteriota bacterium]
MKEGVGLKVRVRVKGLGDVTARDEGLLVWLCRYGVTTSAQAARWWFKGSAAMATRRLRVLVAHGLVRQVRIDRGRLIYLPTAPGARAAGLGLRPPKLSGLLQELDHALLCADVLMALSQQWGQAIPVSFITERELRAQRLRTQREGGVTGWRCPDGVVIRNGVRIAIEVERTAKRSFAVRRIAVDWLPYLGELREFRGVVWLVPSRRVAERYRAIVTALSAVDVFHVAVIGEVIA